MAASKAAQKRLSKEYMLMQKEPPPFVWAVPDEKNILTWNYIIRGPPDSPFAGGEYHGVLLFPPEYPFKPPGIKMLTPSGRFQPDRKICFSMSDFHPGSWNPAWSVATILTGLLSFMLSDEVTTGAIKASDQMKRHYAEKSHPWNLLQTRFKEAFPDFCDPIMKDLPNMAGTRPSSSSKSTPDVPEPFSRTTQLPTPISLTTSATSTGGTTTPSSLSTSTDTLLQQPGVGLAPGSAQAGKEGEVAVVENWINSALRLLWEKWRWGVLIAVAVFVSRATSSK